MPYLLDFRCAHYTFLKLIFDSLKNFSCETIWTLAVAILCRLTCTSYTSSFYSGSTRVERVTTCALSRSLHGLLPGRLHQSLGVALYVYSAEIKVMDHLLKKSF